LKYYLDEDLSPKIAEILRKNHIDAVSAHEVGMLQASDIEQMDRASSEGRCLVTRNRNDIIRLTVQFFNEHRPHAGILIVPHTLPGDNFLRIAKAIIKHHLKHSKGKMESYAIDFLES
jgi:predicted nuclease of predicted toxin-antitoxin system